MRITWTTTTLGDVHANVADDKVLDMVKNLTLLGFTPEVSLDNDSDN